MVGINLGSPAIGSEFINRMAAFLYNCGLLAESQRDRIGVVLVRPRNPLNVGAVARAMAEGARIASREFWKH